MSNVRKTGPSRGGRGTRFAAKSLAATGVALAMAMGTVASGAAAAESGHHHKAKNAKVPVPTSLHPKLKGQSVIIETQGTPTPYRYPLFNVVRLLKSWGANVTLHYAPSQTTSMSAMATGAADVLVGTITNTLPDIQSGLKLEAFGVNHPRVTYALVSNSKISTLSQMKGATIACLTGDKGTIAYFLPNYALHTVGLSMTSSVHVVAAGGQSVRVAALAGGRVTATTISHANLATLSTIHPHVLYTFTKKLNMYTDILWAAPSWLNSHKKLAVAMNLAELETYKFFNNPKNKAAVIALMLKTSTGATQKVATATYTINRKYTVYKTDTVLTPKALNSQMNLFVKYGVFSSKINPKTWANTNFGKAALTAFKKLTKKKN